LNQRAEKVRDLSDEQIDIAIDEAVEQVRHNRE
jgi:hypothetical protein